MPQREQSIGIGARPPSSAAPSDPVGPDPAPGGAGSSLRGLEDHPVVHVSWNDAEVDDGGRRANIWQGEFPRTNTLEDGHLTTAPVRSYHPNGYGLWQAVGNVWEWCEDRFRPATYRRPGHSGEIVDPTGPEDGEERELRGGSYLCHLSSCNRYRNAARSRNTPDSSMGDAGFRTVALRIPDARRTEDS
ncbi:formylglycine-generating enzyme family protein [Brachybacterium squillarum]|uniref:formylglycine-generating enzyme family protein n=1 Tax=Brachybacterium squillarum TaxID=661979 RepID=UPI0039B3E0EC